MKGTKKELIETIKKEIKELEVQIACAEGEKQYTCNRVELMKVIDKYKLELKAKKKILKNF
jgi:hypothetical protein